MTFYLLNFPVRTATSNRRKTSNLNNKELRLITAQASPFVIEGCRRPVRENGGLRRFFVSACERLQLPGREYYEVITGK